MRKGFLHMANCQCENTSHSNNSLAYWFLVGLALSFPKPYEVTCGGFISHFQDPPQQSFQVLACWLATLGSVTISNHHGEWLCLLMASKAIPVKNTQKREFLFCAVSRNYNNIYIFHPRWIGNAYGIPLPGLPPSFSFCFPHQNEEASSLLLREKLTEVVSRFGLKSGRKKGRVPPCPA